MRSATAHEKALFRSCEPEQCKRLFQRLSTEQSAARPSHAAFATSWARDRHDPASRWRHSSPSRNDSSQSDWFYSKMRVGRHHSIRETRASFTFPNRRLAVGPAATLPRMSERPQAVGLGNGVACPTSQSSDAPGFHSNRGQFATCVGPANLVLSPADGPAPCSTGGRWDTLIVAKCRRIARFCGLEHATAAIAIRFLKAVFDT